MRAGLFYFYGLKNSGDMAINIGAIKALKNAGFDEINMLSRYDKNSRNYLKSLGFISEHKVFFYNTQLYPGPFEFERKESILELSKEYIKILFNIRKIVRNSKMQDFISRSDILFFNGGNLLRINSISDLIRMIALFIPVYIAKKQNKKVVLLPHSSNKMNSYQTWLTKKFVKNFDYVYSRENYSYEIFNKMKLDNCRSQIDMCFFKNIESLKERQIERDIRTVAITVRKSGIGDIGTLENEKVNLLTSYLIEFIEHFSNDNIKVVIVNQTKKDLSYSNEIFERLTKDYNVELIEEYDTFSLSKIYSSVDMVLGMRLHSLILAASVGTPIVGLFSKEWGIKNKGTLEMLGLKSIVIENQNENVEKIINYNINNFEESKRFIMNRYNFFINELKGIKDHELLNKKC